MSKIKIFVDGREGTTGLEIDLRLIGRGDCELLYIDPDKRKDPAERAKLINAADVAFLCLPDDAAREAAEMVTNPAVRIIDASTAHRTADGWAYGIPELSAEHREAIKTSKRVSNPGCFPTGFCMLVYPLVKEGILPPDYPICCHAVTGYSGGGKKLISAFEDPVNKEYLSTPCFYSLGLRHKHIPEMQKRGGLAFPPIFTPIIANYYRGMTVAVPLHAHALRRDADAASLNSFYREYYAGQRFVKVTPAGFEGTLEMGYLNAAACNYTNNIEISVFGGEGRILLAARLDNLGKGASGAAVQNMNVMLGLDEAQGLE